MVLTELTLIIFTGGKMREIKFRIWNVDTNRWLTKTALLQDISYNLFVNKNLNSIIIQQYIGVVDKNGLEICEGDLINFSWQAGHKEFYECKNQEVFYNNESASFVFGKDMICMLDRVAYNTLEVVGNVFENPELL
jgi:uncharacterized phage protein (TIGR01671 family)